MIFIILGDSSTMISNFCIKFNVVVHGPHCQVANCPYIIGAQVLAAIPSVISCMRLTSSALTIHVAINLLILLISEGT